MFCFHVPYFNFSSNSRENIQRRDSEKAESDQTLVLKIRNKVCGGRRSREAENYWRFGAGKQPRGYKGQADHGLSKKVFFCPPSLPVL